MVARAVVKDIKHGCRVAKMFEMFMILADRIEFALKTEDKR
jgi:hypothetical protein